MVIACDSVAIERQGFHGDCRARIVTQASRHGTLNPSSMCTSEQVSGNIQQLFVFLFSGEAGKLVAQIDTCFQAPD